MKEFKRMPLSVISCLFCHGNIFYVVRLEWKLKKNTKQIIANHDKISTIIDHLVIKNKK